VTHSSRANPSLGDEAFGKGADAPEYRNKHLIGSAAKGPSGCVPSKIIIIIHLLGLAPAGYLAASDNGA
jgi:hypothetical protein